ncbi:alkaline phosphatase family protein [Sphingomonas donggukensis]|uniref:Alkaline phosphatase n=1 Tax=Sphingomonas donggukensis TaxID=2949093 RepID=A0ABY4TUT4_9SPHN|nr:alkaline phosphatase family protein [Sphingomonas donggukensis]URW76098.1 alkaline phosphatase family protein [Sphingomonas donggukensis]
MKLLPLALCATALSVPALAQQAAPAPTAPPKLLVVISVDQFSADLFAEYRRHFTGGFARLQDGAVFPSGYQSHAATETCPGHSTITTGARPARTGIIANDWVDLKTAREDKTVYCAEDENVPGSTSSKYTVSDKHLLVPTLGERMKAWNPASRVVSVAGKDRAAVMMGGHKVDELWWWDAGAYRTYAGRPTPPVVAQVNALVGARYAAPAAAVAVPPQCAARDRAVAIGAGKSVGTGHFERDGNNARLYRASPQFDAATLALAAGLIREMKLGQGAAPDIISIGASATDYVGHTYGTEGAEMCGQLLSLDRDLGDFFAVLDRSGVDYAVALTADHGGTDLPERHREDAVPGAVRTTADLNAKTIGTAIAAKLGLKGQLLRGGNFGDIWVDPTLTAAQRKTVIAEGVKAFAAHPQVQAVFTAEQIAATPLSKAPPETWSLLERARASYNPLRSGAFVVALKPRITPIVDPTKGYVATHGSFWDYDRRVPMLFWRKGMVGFEQPLSVETVDIAPTLAGLIGLPLKPGDVDGRCLDLVAGPASSCPN